MALADYLRSEARKLGATVTNESVQLEADLAKAHELVNRLRTKVATNNAIERRLLIYRPDGQHEPDCPQCWMMDGEHVQLQHLPPPEGTTNSATMEFWGCSGCGAKFTYDESASSSAG